MGRFLYPACAGCATAYIMVHNEQLRDLSKKGNYWVFNASSGMQTFYNSASTPLDNPSKGCLYLDGSSRAS